MAHRVTQSAYSRLAERLNRFPQGAPPSDLLFRILGVLMDEREAELISRLPIKPFSVEKAGRAWDLPAAESGRILDTLAARGLLVDMEHDGTTTYVLPPPMAGFFEFSMMRLRDDINQKLLSELFYQYLNQEEDFIRALFTDGETQLGRTFVHEPALSDDNALLVLDYERASEVIRTARPMAVSICYCRHKMQHLDRSCDAPLDICMTFNTTAASLIRHGIARRVSAAEGLELLDQAYEHNLVQFGENVRENVNFICNCCACCCEAMIAARRFAFLHPVHTTNFLPVVQPDACTGCGRCVDICPVDALALVSAHDPVQPQRRQAGVNEEICLGCGLCVRNCPHDALTLRARKKRIITPVNSTHRVVMMALERGKLHHLIFDNQVLWSHRALAAVLGVILRLPPLKQALATQQVKSRYLEQLIRRRKE
ncbi:MAG: 4Fe-4S binding protein [Acidobacteria bacterium]|nr:4Fe-4S binding protein [Acidobacteriota bacterium]